MRGPAKPDAVTLYYTPRSHFSRKVRILLDALACPVELVDAGNVADADPAAFGGNPLMRVPTLVDGDTWLVDSDHIAAYLVRKLAPADPFGVLTSDATALNLRAVMNGVMSAEVDVILTERTGGDTAGARYAKASAAIRGGLAWLETSASAFPDAPSYAGFHLVCMWDHLRLYDTTALTYPGLERVVTRLSELPYVATSAPT